MTLPRKQRSEQQDWIEAIEHLRREADPARARLLIEAAAERVRRRMRSLGRSFAYGWSGGKDSQALALVAEAAGIQESVLVISDLEYPAFLAWATDHMPQGLTIVARDWDLDWLAAHPRMLFPQDAPTAAKWFAGVQHWGQRRYCREREVDVLLLGRRKADGNFVGRGTDFYRDRDGFIRWSPIADWSHEDVLYVLAALEVPLPPCYGWPRGFRVGTGPWAARQWCGGQEDGWREVHEIDPDVVATAARLIPSARQFLEAA